MGSVGLGRLAVVFGPVVVAPGSASVEVVELDPRLLDVESAAVVPVANELRVALDGFLSSEPVIAITVTTAEATTAHDAAMMTNRRFVEPSLPGDMSALVGRSVTAILRTYCTQRKRPGDRSTRLEACRVGNCSQSSSAGLRG